MAAKSEDEGSNFQVNANALHWEGGGVRVFIHSAKFVRHNLSQIRFSNKVLGTGT
jgi:hypothetical protein